MAVGLGINHIHMLVLIRFSLKYICIYIYIVRLARIVWVGLKWFCLSKRDQIIIV